MKKINIIIFLYIITLSILTILGILGTNNSETIKIAERYFNPSDIETGKNLFLMGLVPYTIYRIIAILFLLLVLIKKYHEKIIMKISQRINNSYIISYLSILLILLSLSIIKLPFNIYAQFYREKTFGLLNIDFGLWFIRHMSQLGISLIVISLIVFLFITVIGKIRKFYLVIPVLFLVIGLSISIIFPRFITPLFYDYIEIKDQVLSEKIFSMARKADVEINEIKVINKSQYSNRANAYLTGIGGKRRIVLYDTLIKNFSQDEILAILAHEMCHYVEEHMLIGISLASSGMILFLILLNLISKYVFSKDIQKMIEPMSHVQLYILIIVMLFFISPIENTISRTMEKRADSYSLKMVEQPETFIKMKVKLARKNKSLLLPNPIFTWFYYSHPAILDRIRSAEIFLEKSKVSQ